MEKKRKDSVVLDGVEYIRKDSIAEKSRLAKELDGLKFVIVRTYSAGVYFGYLKSKNKDTVVMVDARNIHYWATGMAAAIPQIANDGIKKHKDNRITMIVSEIELTGVIAIYDCMVKAQDNLIKQPVWKME